MTHAYVSDAVEHGRGLAALDRVQLGPHYAGMLSQALPTCGGSRAWALRKEREATDVLAMAELAPRLYVLHLDLDVDLVAVLGLQMPVACRERGEERVTLAGGACLVLRYMEAVLCHPQPGSLFIQVLRPASVFHPNISPQPPHFLCLGLSVPAGIRCKELVLMAFAALTFQTVMLDPREGVMNGEAAKYFAQSQDSLPLTREPFLATP